MGRQSQHWPWPRDLDCNDRRWTGWCFDLSARCCKDKNTDPNQPRGFYRKQSSSSFGENRSGSESINKEPDKIDAFNSEIGSTHSSCARHSVRINGSEADLQNRGCPWMVPRSRPEVFLDCNSVKLHVGRLPVYLEGNGEATAR